MRNGNHGNTSDGGQADNGDGIDTRALRRLYARGLARRERIGGIAGKGAGRENQSGQCGRQKHFHGHPPYR